MFEILCLINLFINIVLYIKLKEKNNIKEEYKKVESPIQKVKTNTSNLFSRLYGDY